jgi:hypothetical protein
LAQPAECARLGADAHERCQRLFDWRQIAQSWAALTQDVIRQKVWPRQTA